MSVLHHNHISEIFIIIMVKHNKIHIYYSKVKVIIISKFILLS